MLCKYTRITKTFPCNIQRFSALKIENFIGKVFNNFDLFAQNIDCRYTLEPPNEYPQSMFWSKIRKIGIPMQTPVFFYILVGSRGYTFHGHIFLIIRAKQL